MNAKQIKHTYRGIQDKPKPAPELRETAKYRNEWEAACEVMRDTVNILAEVNWTATDSKSHEAAIQQIRKALVVMSGYLGDDEPEGESVS